MGKLELMPDCDDYTYTNTDGTEFVVEEDNGEYRVYLADENGYFDRYGDPIEPRPIYIADSEEDAIDFMETYVDYDGYEQEA